MAKQTIEWRNRIVGSGSKPAKEFTANPANWRKHPQAQRDALTGVLTEIGWVTGVIVNKTTGHIVDGHARVEEAYKLSPDAEIPYTEIELSPEEEATILATFDPISAMTEPDKPAAKKPRYGGRKPKLDPELVAAALVTLMGNVAAVARKFEVHRSSLQELIDKRPSLQQIVRDARLAMVDNAESSLNRAVLSGEAWAVCFTLKTQGKDRGYIEKQIIQNENANQPEFDFDKLTDQQKRAILNALRAATGNSDSDDETA